MQHLTHYTAPGTGLRCISGTQTAKNAVKTWPTATKIQRVKKKKNMRKNQLISSPHIQTLHSRTHGAARTIINSFAAMSHRSWYYYYYYFIITKSYLVQNGQFLFGCFYFSEARYSENFFIITATAHSLHTQKKMMRRLAEEYRREMAYKCDNNNNNNK